jgi:serine/threonine protein kinase
MSNPAAQKCPQCGAVLPANAPGGLCPGCLMALNLKTETVFTDDAPAAQPPLPPDQIAPHFPQLEILQYLGRGGMGVVYQVRQKSLNRLAALKLLAPERVHEARFAERFAREAQALAALNHPNIVTIYDFGQAGGFYYLLMEFVDGMNLRQLLRTQKCTPEEALAIVPLLCDALQYAHERGIVHRDIKPENLLLDKSGRVKVADFGIAKMMGTARGEADGGMGAADNVTKSALGTPGYRAPEQKSDPQRVDSRADIYSLGVVFYEMLTGELPGQQLQPPSKKVQIDVRLDEVVLRALEKQPELRYQQASEVKTCLETIAATPQEKSGNQESGKAETGGGEPNEGKSQSLLTSAATKGTAGMPAGKSQMVRIVEAVFNQTFTSPQAVKLINISSLGFLGSLGFLCFLRYLPSPGWHWCFGFSGFFGFAGFFGLIGAAFQIEFVARHRAPMQSGTPAASSENRRPAALTVAGVLFILAGVFSICEISSAAWHGANQVVLGILCLPVGIGLLRLRWWWRWCALVCVWVGFASLLLLLVVLIGRANGVTLIPFASAVNFFGWQPDPVQTTWLEVILFLGEMVLLLWMHRVLTRPGIKALFAAQRGRRTDWLESLVTAALMAFAFGAAPQWAHWSKEAANPASQTFYPPNLPVASAETWSPTLAPGEKPDFQFFQNFMTEAKQLTDTGHYEEALQHYLWFHNHAQEAGDSYQNIVRRTSAITDWVELGRRYPKAKHALLEIRDEKTRKIATGQGYGELFQDVQAINRELQDEDATCALFKTLLKVDKQLAGQCYPYVEGLLMERGEYALCLNFLGDPQAHFEFIRDSLERQTESQQLMEEMRKRMNAPAPVFSGAHRPPDMGQMATNNFVGQVRTLVEILAGTGDQPMAEKIQNEALAVVADARVRSALDDARADIQRRSRPAATPEPQ